jgi:hypothetical protein
MGQERSGKGNGVHAELPDAAFYDGVGGRIEEGVTENLVTKTGAKDLNLRVLGVEFYYY